MTPPERGHGASVETSLPPSLQSPLHGVGRKVRDIFPLPHIHGSDPVTTSVSRKVRRRVLTQHHHLDEVNHTISALNSMYGCSDHHKPTISLDEVLFGTAAAQYDSLEFIQARVHDMGKPPQDLDPPGALRTLRAANGYGDCQPVGSLASFKADSISLPEPGWKPIDLGTLWGDNGQDKVNDFVTQQLLPPEKARINLQACGIKAPFSDPVLRQGRVYHQFLQKLHDSHLIDYSLHPGKEKVGFFCVTKKSGKLRLIVDARRSNAHFADPSHVDLTTGEGLGALEFERGDSITVAQADLKDAFYHLSMPEQLRDYFSLTPVRACDVNISMLSGRPVDPQTRITPRLAVVAMGWTWALHLCQSIHESLADKSGLLEAARIRDRHAPPNTTCCHTEYVDNLIVLGSDQCKVLDSYKRATQLLKDAGLQVHEEEFQQGGKILGWEITQDAIFQPTRHRAWKVRLAIRQLLALGRSSGSLMEKLIGHCSFLCLGRRECFSVFGSVYSFIQKYRWIQGDVKLWPSVRKELYIFDGLIPLIFRDLCSSWSTSVYAVDASEYGLGATISEMPLGLVRQLGHYNERWRFKDPDGSNPRQRILEEQREDGSVGNNLVFFEDELQDDQQYTPPSSNNVPFSAVARNWKTVGKFSWRRPATLPVYEARSVLFAVKHSLRNRDGFGRRHVILSDSMTATCAISRGRSPGFQLRQVCRQIGALALCSGSYYHIRWIPSEWNPADNPSRGIWSPSSPQQFLGLAAPTESSHGHFSPTSGERAFEMDGKRETKSCSEETNKVRQATCHSNDTAKQTATGGNAGSQSKVFPFNQEGNESKNQGSNFGAKVKADDNSRGGFGVTAMPVSLFEMLGFGQEQTGQQKGASQTMSPSGCVASKGVGNTISRWGGLEQCPVLGGQCDFFQQSAEISKHDKVTESKAKFERLEEIGPGKESTTSPVGGVLPTSGTCGVSQASGICSSHAFDVYNVLAPQRSAQGASSRCSEASLPEAYQVHHVDHCTAPSGSGDSFKDPGVRRELATGSAVSQWHWGSVGPVYAQQKTDEKPCSAATHQCRVDNIFGGSHHHPQPPGYWGNPPIPVPPWRSQQRLCPQAQRPAGHTAARTMEKPGLGTTLPKRSTACPDIRQASKRRAAAGNKGRRKPAGHTAKGALSPGVPQVLTMGVFLEIFSGCGILGKTIARDNNWPVLLWDWTLGANYDLRRRENRWKIIGWFRAGFIRGSHLGTPCNTFSRARDRPPGPPPLRSDTHVLGLPGLSPGDTQKVSEGNLYMRFSVAVLLLCLKLRIACTLENPARSRLWLCPSVQQLLRKRFVSWQVCEFCMFGTSWKKPTAILSVHMSIEILQNYRCLGAKRGFCKRTGQKHDILCGLSKTGDWKTKQAQMYPRKFCQVLASCFASFEAQCRAENFQRRLV